MAVMTQDRQASALERIADALEKIFEKMSAPAIKLAERPAPLPSLTESKPPPK